MDARVWVITRDISRNVVGESKCVMARENKGIFLPVYLAQVRLTNPGEWLSYYPGGPWHRGRQRHGSWGGP
jgi:hypothetical protein